MGRGSPSLVALLGLLAVAGYRNRDKLSELLKGLGSKSGPAGEQGGLGGILGGLGGLIGGAGGGGVLNTGLKDLVDGFKQAGQGEAADSWVRTGPNKPIQPNELEQAIGPEVLRNLEERTGLSRSELLRRLSVELPNAVDGLTPDGRLPEGSAA